MSRNKRIDFLRGGAVLLVLFGHNIQYTYHSGDIFFNNILFKIIYSFHMPLFALISGYLLLYSTKQDLKKFFRKKVHSLLIPLISWTILISVIFYNKLPIFQSTKIIFSSYWFIVATLVSSFVIYFVEKYIKNDWIYIILMIMCLFTNFLYISFVFPYFVIGFLFNKYNLMEYFNRIKRKNFLFIPVMLFFILLLLIYKKGAFVYVSGNDILHSSVGHSVYKQFAIDMYRYLIGLIGSVAAIFLLFKVYASLNKSLSIKFKDLIENIGKLSLIFYIFEIIVNNQLISHLNWLYPNIFIWLAIFNIKIAIYIILYKIVKRIPIFNKMLLGF